MKILVLSIFTILSFAATGQTFGDCQCKTSEYYLSYFPKKDVVKIIYKYAIYLSDTATVFKYADPDLIKILKSGTNKTEGDTLKFYAPEYVSNDSLQYLYIDLDDLIIDLVENNEVLIYSKNAKLRVYNLKKTACNNGGKHHTKRSLLLVDNLTADTLISTFQTKHTYTPFYSE